MNKPKVGDKVWVAGGFRKTEPEQKEIGRVGREYFYIDGDKFEIKSGRQASEHNYPKRTYVDIQEYYDEKEFTDKTSDIRQHFSNWGRIGLSLDQIRAIHDIIWPKTTES